MPPTHGERWSTEELEAATEAYLDMLRKELAGEPFVKEEYKRALLAGPSAGRSTVDHRLQNISYVLQSMNLPWVEGFKPLSGVSDIDAAVIRGVVEPSRAELLQLAGEAADPTTPDPKTPEGTRSYVVVNRYERSKVHRRMAIKAHGTTCAVCDLNFVNVYGEIGDGFIHMHHKIPASKLAELGDAYKFDPVEHLEPVCPNCHAMLHIGRGSDPRTTDELRAIVRR